MSFEQELVCEAVGTAHVHFPGTLFTRDHLEIKKNEEDWRKRSVKQCSECENSNLPLTNRHFRIKLNNRDDRSRRIVCSGNDEFQILGTDKLRRDIDQIEMGEGGELVTELFEHLNK